jgi:dTMP kinase
VLCDRYADSSVAYQGFARLLDPAQIAHLNTFATGGLIPDHTFLLDVDPEVGLARQSNKTYMERESIAFHNRVRDGFLRLSAQEPDRFTVLDANGDVDEIAESIWQSVQLWIG